MTHVFICARVNCGNSACLWIGLRSHIAWKTRFEQQFINYKIKIKKDQNQKDHVDLGHIAPLQGNYSEALSNATGWLVTPIEPSRRSVSLRSSISFRQNEESMPVLTMSANKTTVRASE